MVVQIGPINGKIFFLVYKLWCQCNTPWRTRARFASQTIIIFFFFYHLPSLYHVLNLLSFFSHNILNVRPSWSVSLAVLRVRHPPALDIPIYDATGPRQYILSFYIHPVRIMHTTRHLQVVIYIFSRKSIQSTPDSGGWGGGGAGFTIDID